MGSDQYPRIIRGEPLADIAGDRLKPGLSNPEKEGIHTLTEIQKLRIGSTDPKDLEFLKEEEASAKMEIFGGRFLCAVELDSEAKKAGFKGLFILDENGNKRNLFVEDGFLNVKVDALEIMEQLLDSDEAGPWIEGMKYLAYFLKFKSEAEESKRFVHSDPVALAHSKVFAMKEGYECTAEDAARAILISGFIEANSTAPVSITKNEIENQFDFAGKAIAEQVIQKINELI